MELVIILAYKLNNLNRKAKAFYREIISFK